MRTKATLFLIVLVLSLGAVAYYVRDFTLEKDARANQKLVFPVEMVNVDYLEMSFSDRTPASVVLERREGTWELTQPVRWPANFFAVNTILTQLQYLEKVNSFPVASLAENKQTLADFGLDEANPAGWLVLGRGGSRHTVRIGRTTDTNSRMYLLPEDSSHIFVVPNAIREKLTLTPEQLRSPAVFSMQEFEVRFWQVQLTEPGTAQSPGASNVRVYLARDGDKWKIETPIEARANAAAVKQLLGEITKLQVLDFVPSTERTDLPLLGLTSPGVRLTLEGAGRREALLIGNAVPGDARPTRYYAKLEDTPGQDRSAVFTIAPTFLEEVRNAQRSLRERRVLEFDESAVQSIRITDASQREVTLQLLENGAWQVSSRTPEQGLVTMPGDAERIRTLLQELSELSVIPNDGFVRDAALGADLEAFGLTGATAWQVEITERGGNGSGEPRQQRLLFGRTADEPGRPIYARLENRGFVYLVDRAVVDELSARPIDYRSRQVLSLGEGPHITAITLANLGTKETTVSVTLAAGQTWEQALAQETEVRREALLALVRTLPRLKARSIESSEFTAVIPGDTTGRAWTWQLQATITTDTGAIAQNSAFSLYLDNYTGGTELLVGAPDPGLVFKADQALIDAFGPLVFQRPDPDRPPTNAPAAAPAAAP